ncbi:MAG: FHA domain-containing protein [Gemmataceae bacterium]
MNVRLVMKRKRKRVWSAEVRSSEATLGRAQGCTVRIPSAEVSRQHCRLRIENGVVTVEDLESANGTFINNERVRDVEIVHPGDLLSVGPVTFVVEYELSPNALRAATDDDFALLEDNPTDIAGTAAAQAPTDILPMAEPLEDVDDVEVVGTEEFNFDDQRALNLPEGGDLRDFLIELDDSDERAKKRKR